MLLAMKIKIAITLAALASPMDSVRRGPRRLTTWPTSTPWTSTPRNPNALNK